MHCRRLLTPSLLALALQGPAQAHDAASTGALAGLVHPLLGLDHLAMLLTVGAAGALLSPALLLWALGGGVVGALFASVGSAGVLWHGIAAKVFVPGIIAPLVALLVAGIATVVSRAATSRVDDSARTVGMRVGQIGASGLQSIAHGTNDAQKTMGVITLALVANGTLTADAAVPSWVIWTCALAMALGTFIGGWRIIRTMGHGLTHIDPTQGFAAQMSSSVVLLTSSHLGLPLSTTYVATGSVVGTGIATRGNTVAFGDFGLKSTDRGRLTARQIEAARRAISRHVKRGGRIWIRVFPDKPISQKPAEVRMGNGKGNPEYYVAEIQPGKVLYEIVGVPEDLAREAFRLAAAKLPLRTTFVSRLIGQ